MTPKLTHEQARKGYHDATVEMATLDAKLIDAAASLEELQKAHAAAIVRMNDARQALVEARSPTVAEQAAQAETEREIFGEKAVPAKADGDVLGINGAAHDRNVPGVF